MTILTRPDMSAPKPVTAEDVLGPPEPMNTRLANALVSAAPMSRAQLDTVRLHFEKLAAMLLISGPAFSPTRATAIKFHNMTVDRINGINEERRRREREEYEERLLPIER